MVVTGGMGGAIVGGLALGSIGAFVLGPRHTQQEQLGLMKSGRGI